MIGILSFIFDLSFLNIFNYSQKSTLVFPMFTITYILTSLYFRKNISYIIISLFLYISLVGVIYYPFFFFFLSYYVIRSNNKKFNLINYIFKVIVLLFLYDFLLFLIIDRYQINCLFYKIFISMPINILYALLLYYLNIVLNKLKIKYKLV